MDYELRQRLLTELQSTADPTSLLASLEDGRAKLFLTWKVLSFRREHEVLFREGSYIPLKVSGEFANHLCAFARKHEDTAVVVIVPRLSARLLGDRKGLPLGADVWGDTTIELPARRNLRMEFVSILDGRQVGITETGTLRAADVLARWPVALLSGSRAPAT